MVRRHGTALRWATVGVLIAVLAALPALLGALPASDAAVSAAALRGRVLDSAGVAFSGNAESAGGLSLPVTDQLTSVANLFSDRTTMRVWWRGPADNRVDVVTASGERGTHTGSSGSWTWDYEDSTATWLDATALALPTPPDLLPTTLGRRLLGEAGDAELARTGARRVAGRDALGLRLTPAEAASSVRHVDIWVDRSSGLPLQVQVVGTGATRTALDTRFLDLDLAAPSASTTAFRMPAGALIHQQQVADVVLEAGRRIRPVLLPGTLAGLHRRQLDNVPAAIGLYGRGLTLLAVAPVPENVARGLRNSLIRSPAAVVDARSVRVAAGPVGLMLIDVPGGGPYILTGTVTPEALAAAAAGLPAPGGRP